MCFSLSILLAAYLVQIMCTEGICGRVLINTLDQYPQLTSWSTLHQHLGWHIWSTSQSTFGRESTNFWLVIFRHSSDNWPTVKPAMECRVIEMLIDCQLSINQDVDWHVNRVLIMGWLRVSIDAWPQMPLIHKIHWHNWTDAAGGCMANLSQSSKPC